MIRTVSRIVGSCSLVEWHSEAGVQAAAVAGHRCDRCGKILWSYGAYEEAGSCWALGLVAAAVVVVAAAGEALGKPSDCLSSREECRLVLGEEGNSSAAAVVVERHHLGVADSTTGLLEETLGLRQCAQMKSDGQAPTGAVMDNSFALRWAELLKCQLDWIHISQSNDTTDDMNRCGSRG